MTAPHAMTAGTNPWLSLGPSHPRLPGQVHAHTFSYEKAEVYFSRLKLIFLSMKLISDSKILTGKAIEPACQWKSFFSPLDLFLAPCLPHHIRYYVNHSICFENIFNKTILTISRLNYQCQTTAHGYLWLWKTIASVGKLKTLIKSTLSAKIWIIQNIFIKVMKLLQISMLKITMPNCLKVSFL